MHHCIVRGRFSDIKEKAAELFFSTCCIMQLFLFSFQSIFSSESSHVLQCLIEKGRYLIGFRSWLVLPSKREQVVHSPDL